MKKLLIRAVLFVAVLEIAYLGLVNFALYLPVTQSLINQAKPEKFAVHWEKAWSWYPFRVHVRGISANGQSRSQQWQVDTPAVSGTISVLPLVWRSVNISNVTARDVAYHQRPRPRPDKKYTALRAFFPDIEGRKLEDASPANAPKKKKRPWNINLTDARVQGSHRIWIYQIQSDLQGTIQTDFTYQTRKGPMSMSNGRVDLNLDAVIINGNREVVRQGHLKGSVELSPFVPSENKGSKTLGFLTAVLDIETETESLAFLNLYLSGFHGMTVDGNGKLSGHIEIESGKLMPKTDIVVSAPELSMDLLSHRIEGTGSIDLNVKPDRPDIRQFAITFGALQAFHSEGKALLFSGDGLSVTGRGGIAIVPGSGEGSKERYLAVGIPSVKVPDLKIYQRYLPARWALHLFGGQGTLEGKAEISSTGFRTDLKLMSEEADVGLKDYRFTTNLDMVLRTDCPSIASASVDVAGTYLRLAGARLSRQQQGKSSPWDASLAVEKGVVTLDLADDIPENADIKQLLAALEGKDVGALLNTGKEKIELSGKISDLRWLSLLMKNPYNMTIDGAGEVTADVNIASGWLMPGTVLKIQPEELTVNVLDYVIQGDGRVALAVEKGGEHPDLNLDVAVDDAMFRRRDEKKAFIENVAIQIKALARKMSVDGPGGDVTLDLRIPSATVKDMSVYNRYLPPQSPFSILGGQADLTADIHLEPTTAGGFVKLKTKGMRSRINEQDISGELTADITLVGGVPENMDFDISGSSLLLDRVRVAGEEKTFEQAGWYARFDLDKGRAVWKKPTNIEVEAGIEMKDTQPMVAIMANQRGKHGWIEKILTVADVKGEARMSISQDKIVIPYAFCESDDIDIGAKGLITANTRDGVFYARFKKLHGLLKTKDGDRNFDILRAKEKFDEYSPGDIK